MILHNKPHITADDLFAVEAVLDSGNIATGEEVKKLEQDFVDFYSMGEACAVSSGTAALFLALKALQLGKGDIVGVPTYTCSGVLNAILMAGCTPLVMDVNEGDFNINLDEVKKNRYWLKAVIAVHTFGARADVEGLKEVAPDAYIIEDCCQALGGQYYGRPMGYHGDLAIFSFYASKIITGGHGGLVWSKEKGLIDWIRDYRDFDQCKHYKARFNFLLTDIQAAMIRSQFRRLDWIRRRRNDIATEYYGALPEYLFVQTRSWINIDQMTYRFVLNLGHSLEVDDWRDAFTIEGVATIIPIESYELLHNYLLLPDKFPTAEKIAATTLSLPLYPALTDDEVDRVCEVLKDV